MSKTVEDFASQPDFGLLIFKYAIFQFISEATLHSVHGGFRETAAMISNIFFPLFATYSANFANCFVARQRGLGRCHAA